MGDGLSISVSIIAVLQLTEIMVRYFVVVRAASQDRQGTFGELISVSEALHLLKARTE